MLQAGYFTLLVIVFLWIGWGMNKAVIQLTDEAARQRRFMAGYAAFVTVWIGYVSIMAGTGFLADFSLPPKMVLFVVFPALLFIAIFFSIKKTRAIIDAFPIALPVYFQTFRIFVELLIWGLYQEGVGPELATFEGRNLDILAGITAPVVGYLAYNKKCTIAESCIIMEFCLPCSAGKYCVHIYQPGGSPAVMGF